MFVCTRTHMHKFSECTRNHVHERLQLVLRSLQDLDQRRVSQKVLVQSALDSQRLLPKSDLDNQEPGLNLDPKTQRHWEENILQLKEQVRTLKSRDAGLLSQIRDLDRQILQLRLDTDLSHDSSPRPCDSPESSTPDSRPSSGFYDLSDGPSLSNSVFSLCSALDLETTPISPVTPPPAAEASPLLTDMSSLQALLRCSRSSSVPSSSSAPLSSAPSSAPSSFEPVFSSPPSSSAPLFSSVSSSSAPSVFSAPLSFAPFSSAPPPSSAPPSSAPLSAPSSSAPLFSSPPSSFSPSSFGPLSPPSPSFSPSCLLDSTSPPSFSPPPLSPPPPPPLSHLDGYILSLLNGRSLSSRPSQPRTTKLLLSSRSPKGAVVRLPMRPPTDSNEEKAAILGPDAEREARKSRNRSEENLTFNREPSAWREGREVNILRSQRRESRRHKTRRDKNNCTFKCRALKLESEDDLGLKEKTELCCGDKMIHRRSNMDKSTGQRRTFKSDMNLIKNNKLFTLGSKNNIESGGREREEQRGSKAGESRGRTTLRQRELGRSRAEESREGTTLRQRNQKRRRRRRSGAEEEQEDRASLRSCSVRSWRWSLVKSRLRLGKSESGRAVTSQDHTCGRPIRGEHCSEEETGSEGERTGMGGARRQHLVRIKASQNLKKRIQKMKSGTFTLMTTV